jgi:hypothetical protein
MDQGSSLAKCDGACAELIWHIPSFECSRENSHLTPDPSAPKVPCTKGLAMIGSGLKFGQAPPARAEAIVISDLTPDPTRYSRRYLIVRSGLKFGQDHHNPIF